MRHAAAVAAAVAVVLAMALDGDAHKGVTSKFTYNADVYPVFLNRCGRCHIDGGVGGMSLLKYEDAFPWAESLRAELMTAHPNTLPEGGSEKADPHDFVKAAHRQISARELERRARLGDRRHARRRQIEYARAGDADASTGLRDVPT